MKSLVILTVAASLANAQCNANNCLRAVRNAQFPTRGSTDCAAYQLTTVTPSLVTATSTITMTTTPTTVLDATYTTELDVTATVTQDQTQTVTDSATVTNTVQTTTTLPAIIDKRSAAPTIPAYASPCSSAAAFLSACSCIGVGPTTITAPIPTTTITEYATVTPATATVYTTLRTETLLKTVATDTLLTTVASVTISDIATQTKTEQSTVTADCPVRNPTNFYLKASVRDGGIPAGQYIRESGSLAKFTTDKSLAVKFTLRNGVLGMAGGPDSGFQSGLQRPFFNVNAGAEKLRCSLTGCELKCERRWQMCDNSGQNNYYPTPFIPEAPMAGYYVCANPYDFTMAYEEAP